MKLSLGKKIAIGQIIVFIFLLFFSFVVLIYLNKIKNVNIKKLNVNYALYANSKEIKQHVVQVQQFLSDISATKGEDGLDDGFKEAESNYKSLLEDLENEKKIAIENNDLKMIKILDEIKTLSSVYYNSGVAMANLYIKQGTKAGNAYMPNFDKASLNLQSKVDLFSKEVSEIFASEIIKIGNDIDLMLSLAFWFPIVALIVFSIFSYNFIKKLTGQLISMTDELNQTAPQLIESSNSMNSLSVELSSCATEQAAAVQETAASIEEIAAMIGRNSDNAESAKKMSAESLSSVKNGQQVLVEMLSAMDEISKNNESFNFFMTKNNDELNEMVQVITSIADKTKVINDIVFQTKLLSFNASVEAARAGEQGKGFAVVAEEIGNLAQMSGNAANEIKVQLDESIVKVNKIVSTTKSQVDLLINDGKEKIKLGITKAKQCDDVLNEINETSSTAESLVSEVAFASKEQSQGIGEVNKAMGQIDEVTSQNSMASQSISTNASQVMGLSYSIKETADKLINLVNG